MDKEQDGGLLKESALLVLLKSYDVELLLDAQTQAILKTLGGE